MEIFKNFQKIEKIFKIFKFPRMWKVKIWKNSNFLKNSKKIIYKKNFKLLFHFKEPIFKI